jgi:hypothetical protein
MTIIIFYTPSLSSVMICRTTMENFNMSLLDGTGSLFSKFSVVADAAARGVARFSHMSAVPVLAGVACLDTMQLYKTAL